MLKTLNIANNPVSREDKDSFKQYVAAFLPNIEFLDYRLLDQQTVSFFFKKIITEFRFLGNKMMDPMRSFSPQKNLRC